MHSNASHTLAAETSTPRFFATATPPFLVDTPVSSSDADDPIGVSPSVLGGVAEVGRAGIVSS